MTTFVIAALVVAVLLADRLGPPEELRRRLYQVALALAVVLAVYALAGLARPSPTAGIVGGLSPNDPEQADRLARVLRERTIIVVAIALLTVLVSLNYAHMLPTSYAGTLLGGLVLLVLSVADPGTATQIYFNSLTEAGLVRNAVFLGVTGLGTLYLLQYGYRQWDQEDVEAPSEREPVA